MDQLIKVEVKNNQQVLSARDLYNGLEIAQRFSRWVDNNFDIFEEGIDFYKCTSSTVVNNGAVREIDDYIITIDMAKQLAMMVRNDNGKRYRKYFLKLEEKWNDPQEVVKRGYEILQDENIQLKLENKKLKPKATYFDQIMASKSLMITTTIAKDYGMSAKAFNDLLKKLKIQYKLGGIWYLYSEYQDNGWVSSSTRMIDGKPRTLTKWTQKGRVGLYNLLKAHDIVPMIEKLDITTVTIGGQQ